MARLFVGRSTRENEGACHFALRDEGSAEKIRTLALRTARSWFTTSALGPVLF